MTYELVIEKLKTHWPEGSTSTFTGSFTVIGSHTLTHTVYFNWPVLQCHRDVIAELAYYYARDVLQGRFPEAELIITQSTSYAYHYASEILHGRFPEAESIIAIDSFWAYLYAINIIKGRWRQAELFIRTDEYWWESYQKFLRESTSSNWAIEGF